MRQAILEMKNDETIAFEDQWVKRFDPTLHDMNGTLSFGNGAIRSRGQFQIHRKDDRFEITGGIGHAVQDVYDFEDFDLLDLQTLTGNDLPKVARAGEAQPFSVEGAWRQPVHGLGRINGGDIQLDFFLGHDPEDLSNEEIDELYRWFANRIEPVPGTPAP